MTAGWAAFAITGWVLFLSLMAVYARDDHRSKHLQTELAKAEQRREWAERRNGSGVGRVVPMRRRSE